jgi:L-ribulose-5-phosphate 3-epimerase
MSGDIGIMQGRLGPPENGRFQSFPRDRWRDEFPAAAAVPFSCIEWIFDAYGEDVNPIGSESSIAELARLCHRYGVAVRSICADYFMDFPFLRCSPEERSQRQEVLHGLMRRGAALGVNRIVLPFVDASRIDTQEDRDTVVRVLENALPLAQETGVELHLETSLGPDAFARLLEDLPHPLVKVNYDSGNSASLGYVASEEFAAYGHRMGSFHLKDRLLSGGTVPLGTGSADFADVFASLRRIAYSGDIILQVARDVPGDEIDWSRQNIEFLRRYLLK